MWTSIGRQPSSWARETSRLTSNRRRGGKGERGKRDGKRNGGGGRERETRKTKQEFFRKKMLKDCPLNKLFNIRDYSMRSTNVL
jgi:hypothetical protein